MKNKKFTQIDRYILYGFFLMLATIPIIVNVHIEEVISPVLSSDAILGSGEKIDIFSFYKLLLLIVMTCLMSILFLVKIYRGYRMEINRLVITIMVFSIILLLSTAFSETVSTALWGQYNRSEGAVAYLCYLVLFIIAMNINYPKLIGRYIALALMPFVAVNSFVVGLILIGIDLMDVEFFTSFLTLFGDVSFTDSRRSVFMGTLNQWNNTSGIFAALTAFYFLTSYYESERLYKIVFMVLSLFSFAVMVCNISTVGFASLALFFAVWSIYTVCNKQIKQSAPRIMAFWLVAFLLTLIFSQSQTPFWTGQLGDRIWDESFGNFYSSDRVVTNGDQLVTQPNLDFSAEHRLPTIDYELPVLPEVGNAILSSRLYIWEKILLILKDRPLFGYGMDTLLYHFPHFNIDARAGISTEKLIVDKPHSMYIGILYGTGIFGCVAFLLMILFVVVKVVKQLWHQSNTRIIWPFAALLFVYLLQGVTYDSVVGSSFIIYLVMGMVYKIASDNTVGQ